MDLVSVTWQGPPVEDAALLDRLPPAYAGLLMQINGYIQFQGALHIRGACIEPEWHSLRRFYEGPASLCVLYPEAVRRDDIPFAQTALSDQFFLRGDEVWRLPAESREPISLECGLLDFLAQAQQDPVEYLQVGPLVQFIEDGGVLEPGQSLSVYPPYCMKFVGKRTLQAVSSSDLIVALADMTAQLAEVPDGAQIQFKVIE